MLHSRVGNLTRTYMRHVLEFIVPSGNICCQFVIRRTNYQFPLAINLDCFPLTYSKGHDRSQCIYVPHYIQEDKEKRKLPSLARIYGTCIGALCPYLFYHYFQNQRVWLNSEFNSKHTSGPPWFNFSRNKLGLFDIRSNICQSLGDLQQHMCWKQISAEILWTISNNVQQHMFETNLRRNSEIL